MNGFDARARKAAEAVRQQLAERAPDDKRGIHRPQRPARRWIALSAAAVLVAAIAIAVPGLVGGRGSAGPAAGGGSGGLGAAYAAVPLKPFGNCDAVLSYFTEHAPDYLIERAQRGGDSAIGAARQRAAEATGAPDAAGAAQPAAPPHSTTNIQEAGVDEPDLVKTDGKRIVAVARGRVHLIEVDHGRMTLRKTLPDTEVSNLFLSGDLVLVFSRTSGRVGPVGRWAGDLSVLTIYDIARLDHPRLVATLTVEGDVLDARLVGAQVRVATDTSPDLDIPSPVYTDDGQVSEESKQRLRAAVARTSVDDWIPSYTLKQGPAGPVSTGRLVECPDLDHPEQFSGLDTVAVSAFDIGSAFTDRRAAGVVAGGEQLYASDASTYVTSTSWNRDTPTVTTSVHKFVTAASGVTAYEGSGAVPGTLLNQYAMSEHNGVLRVASTAAELRGWTNQQMVNEGMVTMLAERDGALRQLGQIGGLGRDDNESIQAVRFIGDRGYVVTYRQTDPLYVLDLRDPAAPKVVGELKIPGYSGYLHPVGTDLLLGVGQSGEDGGKADGQTGVQFSLFDVSDPAAPRRIDTQTYGGGTALAEWDPKAFLYWKPRRLVIAPVTLDGDQRGRGTFTGVVLLRTGPKGLTEVGRIATGKSDGMANRSLVIGDDLYLLSDQALQSHGLDNHRQIDRLRL